MSKVCAAATHARWSDPPCLRTRRRIDDVIPWEENWS
jgi:hypothetical protein